MRRSRTGSGRYEHPQAWIDHVVATDPVLWHVRLTCRPRYPGRLLMFGQATHARYGRPALTTIGRRSLVSRGELLDTIIHEELHHRLWRRAQRGCTKAVNLVLDLENEEDYVIAVAQRFLS